MAFTTKRQDVVRFYADIAGLPPEAAGDATWLSADNTDLVVHDDDDRQTEPEIRVQSGFVVWFGVDDVTAAFARARAAGCAIGEFHGDYFFARDPDGRYVGFHANEEHGHGGHDHGGHGHGEHGHDH